MRINIFFVIRTFSEIKLEPYSVLLAKLGVPTHQNPSQVFEDGANIPQQSVGLQASGAKSLRGHYIKFNIV